MRYASTFKINSSAFVLIFKILLLVNFDFSNYNFLNFKKDDVRYCSWNGFIMRSCCVALRTMSRYLHCSMAMGEKIMYTCICNWVPMLYSGKKNKIKYSKITVEIVTTFGNLNIY